MNNIMESNGVAIGIRSLWEQGQYLNVSIQVEDCCFKVHKVVVMALSDFFRGMLTGKGSECKKDCIKISGVSKVGMENLISFMYTHKMTLTQENVAEVLAGGVYLQIPGAVKLCTNFIISRLQIDTCRNMLSLFRSFDLDEAADKVISYMKMNVWKMIKTVEHIKLPLSEFHFYVENWQGTEWQLFSFIRDWVHAGPDTRDEHLSGLLSRVRYCLMTPGELEVIRQMPCYHHTPNTWSPLVEAAITYHKLPANLKVLHSTEQATVRGAPNFILLSGLESTFGGYLFEPQERRLVEDKALKTPEGYFRCSGEVDVNNYLVICTAGEGYYNKDKEKWYIFDPRTLQWFRMADPPKDLGRSVLAHDNKHVYAVGELIECYDFQTNTWSTISQLPLEVLSFGAGVYKQGLYVCGGRKPTVYNPVHRAANNDQRQEEVNESDQEDGDSGQESEDSLQDDEDESSEDDDRPVPQVEYSDRMDRLDLSTLKWESKAPMLSYHGGHSLHAMKMFGEEVVCIFNKVTNMEYYNVCVDQWSACSFTLSVPLPIQPDRDNWVHTGPKRWCKGRTYYLADVNVGKKFGREKNACVTITYPEQGTEAVVDFLCEYEGQFQQLSQTQSLRGEVDDSMDSCYEYGGGHEKQHGHPTVACLQPHMQVA